MTEGRHGEEGKEGGEEDEDPQEEEIVLSLRPWQNRGLFIYRFGYGSVQRIH
jgi:hypothetical protein